jgi:hypothetical protein
VFVSHFRELYLSRNVWLGGNSTVAGAGQDLGEEQESRALLGWTAGSLP